MFLRVVEASSLVAWEALATLITDFMGLTILKSTTASTATVTLSLVRISWGGTSKVTVLRSMVTMLSIQGRMVNRPGPTAPPFLTLPSLKITDRSYSCRNAKWIYFSF